MNILPSILAQVDLGAPAATKSSKFVIADPLLILGIAGLIFLVGIFYIAVIRGPKQQSRARRIYKSESDSSESTHSSSGSGRRRKKKKTRRREHRQRNPTLAQVGGLPPPQNPTKEAEFFG